MIVCGVWCVVWCGGEGAGVGMGVCVCVCVASSARACVCRPHWVSWLLVYLFP